MLSSTDLHAAVSAMAGHLEPDGLLLVEPWFQPDDWVDGRTGLESWVDIHQMALWTLDEYSEAFTNAGLLMDHDPVGPTGRGLLIGQASN